MTDEPIGTLMVAARFVGGPRDGKFYAEADVAGIRFLRAAFREGYVLVGEDEDGVSVFAMPV